MEIKLSQKELDAAVIGHIGTMGFSLGENPNVQITYTQTRKPVPGITADVSITLAEAVVIPIGPIPRSSPEVIFPSEKVDPSDEIEPTQESLFQDNS